MGFSAIAHKYFNIGVFSEYYLRVDAAMIAKNGRAGRYYYRPPTSQGQGNEGCQEYNTRTQLTTFGTLVSNKRYGFAYTNGTGYLIRNLLYDANLLYNPPPDFPLASDQYVQLSWDEVK